MNSNDQLGNKTFRKYVKTAGTIYGNGRVYFCEGDVVVGLKEENFDFTTLTREGHEFWLTDGVAVALGYDTTRQDAIAALRQVIRKLGQEIEAKKSKTRR